MKIAADTEAPTQSMRGSMIQNRCQAASFNRSRSISSARMREDENAKMTRSKAPNAAPKQTCHTVGLIFTTMIVLIVEVTVEVTVELLRNSAVATKR